ncbi:putative hydrogenase 1 maturation protease HyaD [Rhodovastum atsumiense]|uniref:Hydrogenase expression/formation protein HupD n=1 Tax=Rhodovastum atsumiense TaxID=504468 RepID=A0A5M6IWK9_9PROT|nr:hydrogenase maturation protease [Rhodovastum atsumiense]KAA5612703.1 hydrogenase maturation protease [Rhodovastum atsumiense]CAH2602746.1 putative hydrogenase 1 maturation protease HyaD [Rhodovastum atsumiense]
MSGGGGTLVLGVGNRLWADEGVGPYLADLLATRVRVTDGAILDGGTQGIFLLARIAEARRLLLLDAVELGLPPGEVVVVRGAGLEAFFGCRALSLHQTSLRDLLAAAGLIDCLPREVVLVGVQVADTGTWGGTLSPPVAAACPRAVAQALAILRRWGAVEDIPAEASAEDAPAG